MFSGFVSFTVLNGVFFLLLKNNAGVKGKYDEIERECQLENSLCLDTFLWLMSQRTEECLNHLCTLMAWSSPIRKLNYRAPQGPLIKLQPWYKYHWNGNWVLSDRRALSHHIRRIGKSLENGGFVARGLRASQRRERTSLHITAYSIYTLWSLSYRPLSWTCFSWRFYARQWWRVGMT